MQMQDIYKKKNLYERDDYKAIIQLSDVKLAKVIN
jgi:hypothetical protein